MECRVLHTLNLGSQEMMVALIEEVYITIRVLRTVNRMSLKSIRFCGFPGLQTSTGLSANRSARFHYRERYQAVI